MVRLDSDKMSKSVGNVFVLHEALGRYGRDALLMYFCGAHYRQPVEFNDARLEEAQARCQRIREAARGLVDAASPEWSPPLRERCRESLANDFNTPRALAAVFEWVREANRNPAGTVGGDDLEAMLDLFALANLLDRPQAAPPPQAVELLERRERARTGGDFATADGIRDQLRDWGWIVRDGPEGPELLPAP
jgi:cysteinyl-tRNA synthetase